MGGKFFHPSFHTAYLLLGLLRHAELVGPEGDDARLDAACPHTDHEYPYEGYRPAMFCTAAGGGAQTHIWYFSKPGMPPGAPWPQAPNARIAWPMAYIIPM